MIFCANKMNLGLPGIIVVAAYLISLVLTPLFHQHPGEHHSASTDTGYHSHAGSSKPDKHAHSKDDNRESAKPHHSSKTITPFQNMVGIVQVNAGDIINPARFSPVLVLAVQSSAKSYSNQFFWQYEFELLPPPTQQDYCVQSATNLSPPQA